MFVLKYNEDYQYFAAQNLYAGTAAKKVNQA